MEGTPPSNTNTSNHHRRCRDRRSRPQNLNPHKRIREEGESSGSACSISPAAPPVRQPSEDDGGGETEAEGAADGFVILLAEPVPSRRVRDAHCPSHGSVSLVGRRRNMEDAVVEVTGFAAGGYGYFAVYDGHGGATVAQACRDRLHVAVAEEVGRRRAAGEGEGVDMWRRALVAGFARVDAEVMGETRQLRQGMVGSTAVVAVVAEKWIIVANCGDSRAVLSRGGVAVPLSIDHKPDRPDERGRVEALGGRILCWDCPRVLGVLATSRSFGDYLLKPYVSSDPEFMVTDRSEEDEFLVLASDGLWDVISSEMACRVIRKCMASPTGNNYPSGIAGSAARDAAAVLARLAISRGSFDNVSVVVVELRTSRVAVAAE
ncbi:unnamed protein product [Musa acuminata var. zebrina]